MTFISFCVLPYCSGKEKIWLGMPFGSSKLFSDLVLQKFHKTTNASHSRWSILKNTLASPCLWLKLWRLHSFHSRVVHDFTLILLYAKTTQFCCLLINHKLLNLQDGKGKKDGQKEKHECCIFSVSVLLWIHKKCDSNFDSFKYFKYFFSMTSR